MGIQRPWNCQLAVPKTITMMLIRPLMTDFKMTVGADFCFCKEPPPAVYKSSCPPVWQLWGGAVSLWTEVHSPTSRLRRNESRLFFLRGLLKGGQQEPTLGHHITHATEGKNSRFLILKDQTRHPPIPDEDIISEGIKRCGSEPKGLAGWQNDWHSRPHCLCSLQWDPVVFAELWAQLQAILLWLWQRRNHLSWRWMQSRPQDLWVLNLASPWCQDPTTLFVWYLARNSWSTLKYFLGSLG